MAPALDLTFNILAAGMPPWISWIHSLPER
jgi:hypothetical protein